jgi:hypothetical protein
VRVVGALGAAEAFEVTAVGVGGTGGVVLGQLEVDVVAAGGERADALPRGPDPGHVAVKAGTGRPGSGEAGDVAGVAVADRAVVGRPFVRGAADVEDEGL